MQNTTSIRLTAELTKKLERTARALHQGKNWIIKEALEAYLQKLEYSMIEKEARRQSLLASKKLLDDDWQNETDIEEWK